MRLDNPRPSLSQIKSWEGQTSENLTGTLHEVFKRNDSIQKKMKTMTMMMMMYGLSKEEKRIRDSVEDRLKYPNCPL
ncbi:unnamed protein product [Prunus armeniaca]